MFVVPGSVFRLPLSLYRSLLSIAVSLLLPRSDMIGSISGMVLEIMWLDGLLLWLVLYFKFTPPKGLIGLQLELKLNLLTTWLLLILPLIYVVFVLCLYFASLLLPGCLYLVYFPSQVLEKGILVFFEHSDVTLVGDDCVIMLTEWFLYPRVCFSGDCVFDL